MRCVRERELRRRVLLQHGVQRDVSGVQRGEDGGGERDVRGGDGRHGSRQRVHGGFDGELRSQRDVRWQRDDARVRVLRGGHVVRQQRLLDGPHADADADVHGSEQLPDVCDGDDVHGVQVRDGVRAVRDELQRGRGLPERVLLQRVGRVRGEAGAGGCVHGGEPVHERQLRGWGVLRHGVRGGV